MPRETAAPLERYRAKRDFGQTPEPRGVRAVPHRRLGFVVQKHDARRLHYDFRLELDGVLLSWAIPKGPSYDPADRRLAVRTEDHPLAYASFEGTIPPGQYGAGTVIVWDRGSWQPIGDPHAGLRDGKLAFRLRGEKLDGEWELVRLHDAGARDESWLLFKKRDGLERRRSEFDVVEALPDSVIAAPRRKRPDAARRAAFPQTLAPQLATLADRVPDGGPWIYEVKFDGYRVMARVADGVPKLITRGGHDWTARLPDVARELAALGLDASWLDGEIVALRDDGISDFNALQNAFDRSSGREIVYFVFDAPYFEGRDLRDAPLVERRALLERLFGEKASPHVRFSAATEGDPDAVLRAACRGGLEGVIAKRADAPYRGDRTRSWLKLKCQQRQEFVIAGFTDRADDAARIGSLLLGVHDADGSLIPAGRVGTGWDSDAARTLHERLARIETEASPFEADAAARRPRRSGEHWVKPQLVAEVAFGEWTPGGQVRHASFVGIRLDKPAKAVVREQP